MKNEMVLKEKIIERRAIERRIMELGRQITLDYHQSPPLVVGVLKGAFIFLADLVRAIDLPLLVDFIRVASYGISTDSSGTCVISKHVETEVCGRNILLVEDIADTGTTLAFLHDEFMGKGAKTVKNCVLIDKTERRQSNIVLDYIGFEIPSGFLVGYGLDYAEQYRHLPEIYECGAVERL